MILFGKWLSLQFFSDLSCRQIKTFRKSREDLVHKHSKYLGELHGTMDSTLAWTYLVLASGKLVLQKQSKYLAQTSFSKKNS